MEKDVFQVQGTRVGDGSTLHLGHTYQENVTVNHAVEAEPAPSTVCDIPDFLSRHYVGRVQELARIEDAFDKAANDGPARCIVYGMPGLGKTQLALKYAESIYEENSIPYIFWISAASPEKLVQGFSRLLDLIAYPNRNGLDQPARCLAARRWLEGRSVQPQRRWLLVLDNANKDTADDLWKMLPRSNANGRILFTTRSKSVAEILATAFQRQYSCIELHPLGTSEAVELFSSISNTAGDPRGAQHRDTEELVKLVGRLPLAIDQAASFVAVSQTPVSKVVETYKSAKLPNALEWENELSRYSQPSIMATYTAALDELQEGAPGLVDLLRIVVFLDPECIPITLLKEGCSKVLPTPTHRIAEPVSQAPKRSERNIRKMERLSAGDNSRVDVQENSSEQEPIEGESEQQRIRESNLAITKILVLLEDQIELHKALVYGQKLSLFQVLTHENETALRMHDLVHLILRRKLSANNEEGKKWLFCTLDVISNGYRDHVRNAKTPSSWSKCEQILPHVRALQTHVQEYEVNQPKFLYVCNQIGAYLTAHGREDDAARVCEQTLAQYRRQLGEKHPSTLLCVRNLAISYLSQKRLDAAEILAKEALETRQELLEPLDPETVDCACVLSRVHLYQGRDKDANRLIDEAAETLGKVSNLDDPRCVDAMRSLARSSRKLGRLEQAAVLQERAMEARKRLYGPDHIKTLHIMDDLAKTYKGLDRLEEAEALLLQIVEAFEGIWGSEHRHTASSMHYLAETYARQKRWFEAAAMLEVVVRVYEANFGADHRKTQSAAEGLERVSRRREQQPHGTATHGPSQSFYESRSPSVMSNHEVDA